MANSPQLPPPDIAYYYPNPYWLDGDWIKNLILFFDGVAVLLPESIRDRPFESDPVMAYALKDEGLLHIIEPETYVDASVTKELQKEIARMLSSGALDDLNDVGEFVWLSRSRLGYMGDPEIAEKIFQSLRQRGLAGAAPTAQSIPLNPLVRTLVLVLLSQILKKKARLEGMEFHPTTDHPEIHHALRDLLSLPTLPSAGHVVSVDVQTVGIDLTTVPVDEVLHFRRQEGKRFKAYARELRSFVRDLSISPPEEQENLIRDRREEIRELADSLANRGDVTWRSAAGVGLGILGAIWTLHQHDPIGALIAGSGALTGLGGSPEVSVYDYLFEAKRKFG